MHRLCTLSSFSLLMCSQHVCSATEQLPLPVCNQSSASSCTTSSVKLALTAGAAHQQALPQGSLLGALHAAQLPQGAQHSPAQHSPPQAQGSRILAESSPSLKSLQECKHQAGLPPGPVDWWQNALYSTSELQACLLAQSSAAVQAEPSSQLSSRQDAPANATSSLTNMCPRSAAYTEASSGNWHRQAEVLSSARGDAADSEAARAAAARSPRTTVRHATVAALENATAQRATACPQENGPAGSVTQPGITRHQHQHAVQNEGSNVNAAPTSSMPGAVAGLQGLSLLEATPLLQLINSLQAAGALAAPSSADAQVDTCQDPMVASAPVAEKPVGPLETNCLQPGTCHRQLQVYYAEPGKHVNAASVCSGNGAAATWVE